MALYEGGELAYLSPRQREFPAVQAYEAITKPGFFARSGASEFPASRPVYQRGFLSRLRTRWSNWRHRSTG